MSEGISICVFCGSANDVDASYIELAKSLGAEIAKNKIRLVYGGGNIGLMGATARSAHFSGGEVLGIIPEFLLKKERLFEEVEHRIVDTMHTRKQMMFDESDAFIVLPGGIGTLEEAVEVLSWARLGMHAKPTVFLDSNGFWQPFIQLMQHIVEGGFMPTEFLELFAQSKNPSEAIKNLKSKIIQL